MRSRSLLALALWPISYASAQGVIATFAGSEWVFGADGRPGGEAPLGEITGVALDGAGNVYIADPQNHLVFRVTPAGVLSIFAGSGLPGFTGDGGPAAGASLNSPTAVALDASGNVYIADTNNHRVRRVSAPGIITTFAGNGRLGFRGDNGPATSAEMVGPTLLAVDAQGGVSIYDSGNQRIRIVAPNGIIRTTVGNGQRGFGGDGGPAIQATLGFLRGIAIHPDGSLLISDSTNNRIRRVSGGVINTVAGTGVAGFGGDGGPATGAILRSPSGIAVHPGGGIFFLDSSNERIRRFPLGGTIATIAGNGAATFGGDGGPPLQASFFLPSGIAIDAAFTIFVADTGNSRVRRITPTLVTTFAGNGRYRAPADGVPATSTFLNQPRGVAVDPNGSVYIADGGNSAIDRVGPDGIVRIFARGSFNPPPFLATPEGIACDRQGNVYVTDVSVAEVSRLSPDGVRTAIAGTRSGGFSGDNGPATAAQVNFPEGIAVDANGVVYLADTRNHRIRRIQNGIITTIAGNGTAGFAGDGGQGPAASLNSPRGISVGANGNLYWVEPTNRRVRTLDRNGRITTFAGTGATGSTPDGDTALNTVLNFPLATAVDAAGNVYIADAGSSTVRRVSNGIVTTIAGTALKLGFAGDGGPATSAQINTPSGLAVDGAGNVYITDNGNHRVRVVLAAAQSFTASPAQLSFTARSGGSPTSEQSIAVNGPSGLAFTAAVNPAAQSWLRVTPDQGAMPATVRVRVDPSQLPAGARNATITITAPNATPATRTVDIAVALDPAEPPRLDVDPASLTYAFARGSTATSQQIAVLNRGGGNLDFTASAATTSGGGWLAVAPTAGRSTPSSPATLTVVANPGTLAPGTYSGRVAVASPATGESKIVTVTMTISAVQQTILLSQTGLTFTAVVNGGQVLSQNFGVLNIGSGVMNWTTRATTLSGGAGWLIVNPASGSTDASSLSVPLVDVAIDAAGLAPGDYYGQIEVASTTAENSPQIVSVVLNVLAAGANPGPVVRPTGLIFTAFAGGDSPGAQSVLVANVTAAPTTFASGRLTLDRADWFLHAPTDATVPPGAPVRIVVQPSAGGLTPEIRRGVLTLLFGDGSVRNVNLLFVLVSGAPGAGARAADGDCVPTRLLPVFTQLTNEFNVPAAWPAPIEARVVDDCGVPMTSGSVVASFSNGDPPLVLAPLKDGRWSGTWQPRGASGAQVTVTVGAESGALRGSAQITGGLRANPNPPAIGAGAVVSAASQSAQAPPAPGSLVTIYGSRLSDAFMIAPSLPLSTSLGGTLVTLAGRPLPLAFVSENQINALLPYDVPVNTRLQLLVRRGTSYTAPEPVLVAPAQPAIFSFDLTGVGQGHIYVASATGAQTMAGPAAPARAGDVLVIYCAGLGAVNPPVGAGQPAPSSPLARTASPVTLTIGGVEAEVFFSGLAPTFAGLYQVNAIVPPGVAPGDAVAAVLNVAGQSSPPVTMAVR